jgi:hypothetical protein
VKKEEFAGLGVTIEVEFTSCSIIGYEKFGFILFSQILSRSHNNNFLKVLCIYRNDFEVTGPWDLALLCNSIDDFFTRVTFT